MPNEKLDDTVNEDVAAPREAHSGRTNTSPKPSENDDVRLLSHQNSQLVGLAVEQAEAISALDAFLSVIGHELRNPMTPVLGKVQLLRRGVGKGPVEPEKIEQSLEQIEWLLLRYNRRATTLLDISRLGGGTLELQPIATDIRELRKEVVANLSPLAGQSGSTIGCVLPAEAVVGSWDLLALEQILDNLFTNAIKSAKPDRSRSPSVCKDMTS